MSASCLRSLAVINPVFSPVCSCRGLLSMANLSKKNMEKLKSELKSVEFTPLSAKYSLKSENSPNKPK